MIILHTELELEEDEMQEWTQEKSIPELQLDKLEMILENPPKRCEDKFECVSYHLNKNHCRCIRTIFPHKSHYDLFLLMAEAKIESELSECIDEEKHLSQ
jgi:hypothetical protein|tara:strand:- start:621 stop:920 length:300 start_codon:yes stop_codon:yes gene_type:complete